MSETDPRITGFNNDYDLSKFLAESLVMDYAGLGLFTVIATAAKVFGPGIGPIRLALTVPSGDL